MLIKIEEVSKEDAYYGDKGIIGSLIRPLGPAVYVVELDWLQGNFVAAEDGDIWQKGQHICFHKIKASFHAWEEGEEGYYAGKDN